MSTTHTKLLDELVEIAVKEGASDIHLSEGRPAVIRVSGFLIPLAKIPVLSREDVDSFLSVLLSPPSRKEFDEKRETDFAYSHLGSRRFRCNVFLSLGKVSIAMRLVPDEIESFSALNLPPILESFSRSQQGFFLVVGPTGVGKSTTLAAMIETINLERLEHVITIEDPIEYVFKPKKAIINQREVKLDTPDFHSALQGVSRQDTDILMIGEMRDPETISTAVTAAETGHLVLSTLHTNTAGQTVDRIIDSFPADQQTQIRIQLAGSLLGIFSQRLLPRISGGLVPAFELLIATTAVRNLIREGKNHELDLVIETSAELGMITLNQSLLNLVQQDEITFETALAYSIDPKNLETLLGRR